MPFGVVMRASPTLTSTNLAASGFPTTGSLLNGTGPSYASWYRTSNSTTNGGFFADSLTFAAEL
jgi:hypothetical protein